LTNLPRFDFVSSKAQNIAGKLNIFADQEVKKNEINKPQCFLDKSTKIDVFSFEVKHVIKAENRNIQKYLG